MTSWNAKGEIESPDLQQSDNHQIGQVVSGSLLEGLTMKLDPSESVEDIRAGKFVVVDGEKNRFFSMITDVKLSTSARGLLDDPPRPDDDVMRKVLRGAIAYGSVSLKPMLMLPRGDDNSDADLHPVKTVPGHFSPVFNASKEDVSRIFGDGNADSKYFEVGTPLDMDTPVCLNLERFVERSNGIFGKSGTGKTFLTRIVLSGIIGNNKGVNLIFDMHSEYGWKGTYEDNNRSEVRGLKQYFRDKVAIFTLDPESSRRRNAKVDFEIKIPYSQVTLDDIVLLQDELNLSATAVETCYALVNEYGEDRWLSSLVAMTKDDIKEFCESVNVHEGALSALQRKLLVLTKSCQSFLIDDAKYTIDVDAVRKILNYLENGKHVVVEFGQHRQPLRYMLVANILTRHIHEIYVRKTEENMGSGGPGAKPLVITIEEAHKFLSPALAGQTIFGTIAREMRKYNVTLLIVDQRPSGIDNEILSQVGTRITCLLNDEKDIDAVLTGVSNASGLRGVLASLDSKQQALILGHAVPMPVVIRTRTYDDEAFRKSIGEVDIAEKDEMIKRNMESDFPV